MIDKNKQAGGVARAKSLSKEERSAIARKAALSRHRSDLPKAIAEGVLVIGSANLACAVLDDPAKTRVLTQNGFLKALGRHPFATGGTGASIDGTAPFLRAKNLKPFISEDLERSTKAIEFLPKNPKSGADGIGYGYPARLLPNVCWVYQDAMLAGKLHNNQKHIGEACRNLLKALTDYAIDDLVDRATGYEDFRKKEALDRIIDKYCGDRAPYVKMFKLDFYREIFRLNNWPFDPENTKRPGVVGRWTNDIYDRLAPGIRVELHKRVKRNLKGKPTEKLTQYLTPEEGRPELLKLLEGVIALMKVSGDWKDFQVKLNEVYPKFDQNQYSLELRPTGNVFELPLRDFKKIGN